MPQKSSFLASKEEGYIPIASFFKIQFHISVCLTVSFLAAIKKVRLLHLHPLLHVPRLDNGECHLDVLKYKIQIQIYKLIQIYKKYKYTNKYKYTKNTNMQTNTKSHTSYSGIKYKIQFLQLFE